MYFICSKTSLIYHINRKIINLYKHAIGSYGNIAQSIKKPIQDKLTSDEPDTLQVRSNQLY